MDNLNLNELDLDSLTYEQRDDLFVENNATRIGRREELLGPSLDANQMEGYYDLPEKQVLGRDGKIIGYKSVVK